MNLEQIEVFIDANGKVHLQTSGFTGDDCLKATQELEALLGNQILERERTAETYNTARVNSAEKLKIHKS